MPERNGGKVNRDDFYLKGTCSVDLPHALGCLFSRVSRLAFDDRRLSFALNLNAR